MEFEGVDTMELDGGAARASGGGGSSAAGGLDDRLSALPDNLLHVIMSFLKARQAVQTCVLATRWRHLWRSVPCLDVDHDEFRIVPKPSNNNNPAADVDNSDIEFDEDDLDDNEEEGANEDDDDDDIKDIEWETFEDFADSLMDHCNIAMLDSLRLRVNKVRAPSFASRQASGWLRRAMKYCSPDPRPQREGLGSTNSWRLKRLYLCNVALGMRFRDHVGSVFQSLEDLELEDCSCAIEAIVSNSLKSLVLKNCRWRILFQIISPTLKSLAITGGLNHPDFPLYIMAPAIAHLCLDVPFSFADRLVVN